MSKYLIGIMFVLSATATTITAQPVAEPVIVTGRGLPGLTPDEVVSGVGQSNFQRSASGALAALGSVETPTGVVSAVYYGRSRSELGTVLRAEQQVPGLPAGFVYSGADARDMAINSLGQVVILAGVTTPEGFRQALLAISTDGDVAPLLITRESLDVGDVSAPDVREVSFITFNRFGETALTDAGIVTVGVSFTGGSSALLEFQLPMPSEADFNGDGVVNADDLRDFVMAAVDGNFEADIDGSNAIDFNDVIEYVRLVGED